MMQKNHHGRVSFHPIVLTLRMTAINTCTSIRAAERRAGLNCPQSLRILGASKNPILQGLVGLIKQTGSYFYTFSF